MYRFFTILLFCWLLSQNHVFAQFHVHISNDIAVEREGIQLSNPWAGGINAGQISRIDANLDGLEDVFVFDRSGNKVMVFLNNGSDDPNTFSYSYIHSQAFPYLRNWALLRDYNCDGKKDIFTYNGIGGFRIFKNVSSGSELAFEEVEDNLQSFFEFAGTSYFSNIFISSVDIPAVDDMDGDGDLDIMVYSVSGVLMEYHRNLSVEQFGNCDSLSYALANRCYGFFSESAFDNSISLHDEDTHSSFCPNGYNVANPSAFIERPDDIEYVETTGGPRHAGTTIATIEMNQSFPKEIVLGDISHQNLTALTNSVGELGLDSVISQDTAFPLNNGGSEAVDIPIFPAAFYEDMDNDGVRDLVVCPNNEWASENTNSVWYYRNEGADDSPVFSLQYKNLFQRSMIDVGEGGTAVFFDHNEDGLEDLLVANKGYFISPGIYESSIALYENTGTSTSPSFTHITDDYMGIRDLGLGQALHPTFGDLDGDGDDDMLVGTSSGVIYVFYNTAGPGNTAEFEIASEPILKDDEGQNIDPGQFATPQLYDLTGDGLQDLVMGERNGNVHFYENIGSADNPSFSFVNDFLGGVETAEGFSTTGYSIIQFFEMDGATHLIAGTESGKIRLYSNIDNNLNGEFTLENDNLFGIRNGIRSSATLTDINNDGYLDLFTGNFSGGLLYFKGSEPTSVNDQLAQRRLFEIFPNPTSDVFTVVGKEKGGDTFQIEIYDALGRKVHSVFPAQSGIAVSVSHLHRGMYVIHILEGEYLLGAEKLIVR